MKQILPLEVFNRISTIPKTCSDFHSLTEKQNLKLINHLIELYYYIYSIQVYNSDYNNEPFEYYVNIHNKDLAKFKIEFNKKKYFHQTMLKLLESAEVININHSWSVDNFTKGYQVNLCLFNGKEITWDFKSKISYLKEKKYYLNKYPKYRKLINDIYKTKINVDEYFEWLDANHGIELTPVYDKKEHKYRYRQLNYERIIRYKNQALKLNSGYHWMTISNEGRLYSSITALPSSANNFLMFDNEPLIELDIKNCQPLLLAGLIDNSAYKLACEQGIFYDLLSQDLGWSRDYTKLILYKYLFFGQNELKSGRIYSALENHFEGLNEAINALKSNSNLACELQNLESNIIIKGIALNFVNTIVTKHDAIFVKQCDVEIVKRMITHHFKEYKLKPKIK